MMSDLGSLANLDHFRCRDSDDRSTNQNHRELNTPEPMPTATLTSRFDDLENQLARDDLVGEKQNELIQLQARLRKPSTQCERVFSCACHKLYRIKTPSVLCPLIGSAVIKANGTCGLRSDCNENSCVQNRPTSFKLSYRFPSWLLDRMIFSALASGSSNSPQFSLMAPRIIPNTSYVFYYASSGSLSGLAMFFESRLVSPHDVSADWGDTPLHMSNTLNGDIPSSRELMR